MPFDIEERPIDVADLQLGMFVCRLDRPWEETPFPLDVGKTRLPAELLEYQRSLAPSEVDVIRAHVGHGLAQNQVRRLRPRVAILSAPNKQPLDDFRPVDLMQLGDKDGVDIVRSLTVGDYGIDASRFFLQ